MKLFIFLLLLSQQIFAAEPKLPERTIAILVRRNFRGEISFAHRVKAACGNICWEADVLDQDDSDSLEKKPMIL